MMQYLTLIKHAPWFQSNDKTKNVGPTRRIPGENVQYKDAGEWEYGGLVITRSNTQPTSTNDV